MTENNINQWQTAMEALPDKMFFNTMRLYLGEIKTPYNKQRLIGQLANFIHNQENTSSIITLLDNFDVQVLSAISIIPNATRDSLIDFFDTAVSKVELFAEIVNLKERLLIYGIPGDFPNTEFLYINPLLQQALEPYLSSKILFPDYTPAVYSTEDIFSLSPNLLTAFISYIQVRGIGCKADGTIKKNDAARLYEIFPRKLSFIQLLMNAFINLSLVKEGVRNYELDRNRIEAFAKLNEMEQYALLCAASVSRFSKEGLKKEAQLLIDCLSSIPETGYTRSSILRLAFLAGTYTEDGSAVAKKGRFTRILEAARFEHSAEPVQNYNLMDRMIDSAIEFGLLQKLGKTEDNEELYIAIKTNEFINSQENLPKVLNIDSTFTVTLMPGLSLQYLLPLTSFMIIRKCGVVSEFEINRKSVAASFDQNWTPKTIYDEIEKLCNYEIPQNLKINISEWYNSYSSAILYKGYVLKVQDTNISFAENNPNIKKFIKEKLAEGVYLLNIPLYADISDFIDTSGLAFLGNVKTAAADYENSNFPLLRPAHTIGILSFGNNKEPENTSIEQANALLEKLKSTLAQTEMEEHQKESIEFRISNRLILSENQLKTTCVRTEILEAQGTDFSGKIHLIEAAIKENDLMELKFPDRQIMGYPMLISRQPGEAVLRFQVEPTKEIENILVSRITHLRRIRY